MQDDQSDDCNVICPHCLHSYQAEAEDFDETEREEECQKCGGRYIVWQSFSVTNHTKKIVRRPALDRTPAAHNFRARGGM